MAPNGPGRADGFGGLFDGFEAYRTASDDEVREVLRSALVVIDTNVLLNMYRYNDVTRTSIVELMAALGDRLFVPYQVLEEFWRNRERALAGPLAEVRSTIAELQKFHDSAVEQVRMWVNRSALAPGAAGVIEARLDDAFAEARLEFDSLIDDAQVDHARSTLHDPVLAQLQPVLQGRVGPSMDEAAYKAALKEGQRRADVGEPPGFADAKKSDRGPEGAAGDYLVWEQLIVEATRRGSSTVAFVTGDVKRDWWRFESGNPRGPRIELAREIAERCGANLHMLRPDVLLRFADTLAVSVLPDSLEDVERTTLTEEPPTEETGSGWSREPLIALLRQLAVEAPVQESCVRFAARNGGFIGRDDVYRIGEYDPDRQLKGFTRPVNRIAQMLRERGEIPEDSGDVLVPVYDQGDYGFGWVDGFRVPNEIIALLNER